MEHVKSILANLLRLRLPTGKELLFLESGGRIATNGILSVWLSYSLGAEAFGLYSYLVAISMLFFTFSRFGLDSLFISRFGHLTLSQSRLVSASIAIRLICITITAPFFIMVISNDLSNDALIVLVIIIFAGITNHLESMFFVSENYLALAKIKITILLGLTSIKVGALASGYGYELLFLLSVVEFGLLGILYAAYYTRNGISGFKNIPSDMIRLCIPSFPLALSAFAAIAYTRTDQIMLKALGNEIELGQFALAARISEATLFLPVLLGNILIQKLQRKIGVDRESEIISLYRRFFWLGLAMSFVSISISAGLETFLLASDFLGMTLLCVILGLALPFSFLGIISGRIFANEKLQAHILRRTLIGLLLNIMGNVFLIGKLGALGCAVSTLICQISANVVYDLFNSGTRAHFKSKMMGIMLK